MLYNVYHEYSSGGFHYDIGIGLSVVNKMVESFWRDVTEIKFDGRTYHVGETTFQIFEVPQRFGEDVEKIKEYYFGYAEGVEGESVFSDSCKNVTKEFIKSRERGALKEDLYNIYINVGDKQRIKTTIEKSELLTFINCWHLGKATGWLDGTEIPLTNAKTFQIYDIKFEYREGDRGDTKKYINRVLRVEYRDKWTTQALEGFGKNVTHSFKIGPFGSHKQEPSVQKKSISEANSTNLKTKIFISHSSKDKHVVTKFVNEILVLSLGVEQSNIFCTSIEGLGITSGEDFRSRIKNELLQSQVVIQMISKDYKSSEVCLNEMGAAWVLSTNVIPLVIDGSYDVGFIHKTTQQLNLNEKTGILQFIDDWGHLFPNKSKGAKINGHIEELLKLMHEKIS